MKTNTQQPILIIAGMHRSGTSFVSSLLQSAGLDIGEKLVPANENNDNPKGYFENVEFVNFHEAVLQSLGIDKIGWTLQTNIEPPEYFQDRAIALIKSNESKIQPWGWKEPRTTLFLDFWAKLLPEAKFLFMYRNPWDVLDSLYRRGDPIFIHNPKFALQIWQSYNQAMINFSEIYPERCLFANIDQIIGNPQWLIETINTKLSIPLSSGNASLFEKELFHQSEMDSQRPMIIKDYFPDAFQMYCDLNSISQYKDSTISHLENIPSSSTWLLKDWLEVRKIEREIKLYKKSLDQVYHQLGESQAYREYFESQLEASREEVTHLSSQLEASREEITHLSSQLEASREEVTHLSSQLEASREEVTHLSSQLEASREEITHLSSQLEASREEITHLSSQLETSKGEINSLSSQLQLSQQVTVRISSLLESSRQEYKDIFYQLSLSQQQVDSLTEDLRVKEREKQETEGLLYQSRERINAMETSKFWKMRRNWFKLKKSLGITSEE